jgi:hypothetical protein
MEQQENEIRPGTLEVESWRRAFEIMFRILEASGENT